MFAFVMTMTGEGDGRVDDAAGDGGWSAAFYFDSEGAGSGVKV